MMYRFLKPAGTVRTGTGIAAEGIPIRGKTKPRNRALFAIFFLISGSAFAQNPQHWMGDLKYQIGNLPLNQVAIPGTHDSGTYSLDKNSAPSIDSPLTSIEGDINSNLGALGQYVVDPIVQELVNPLIYKWAVAQDPNDSFLAQLNAGIRYFDIRPCMDSSGVVRVCHSLYGTTISDLVGQVRSFSLENPDEIIILDFNHITSHGIAGIDSINLATEIISGLTNLTNGDMIIPHQHGGPGLTLNQIWTASPTARIIVLDDDSNAVENFNYHLWPGQGLHTADIHSPWPGQDAVDGQIQHEIATFECRCDEESAPYFNGEDASTLFVVQTNVTPDTALIGGDLINQIKSNLGSYCGFPYYFCNALDAIRSAENWPSNPPPGIHALADQTNTRNYDTEATGDSRQSMLLAGLIEKKPSLRQNLNIVQADWFGEMYSPNSTTVIPSPYVSDMIKLNTPPEPVYLSPGSPWYSPYGQLAYGTSHTPFTVNATDVNWGISNVYYSFGSYKGSGKLGSSFTIGSSPTPQPDGYFEIYFGATNNVGVSTKMTTGDFPYYFILDNTPPVMTITTPANGSGFAVNGPDLMNYTCLDAGSGTKSCPALIDGKPAPDNGQPFLAGLSSGIHTFTLGPAVDQLGNSARAISVTFSVGSPYTPALSTVSPNRVVAGTVSPEILAVSGSLFVPGSVVQCNGTALTTRFINNSQLWAYLPPSLMATPSTAAITVANLAPGGGVSTSLPLSIVGLGETAPPPDTIWSEGAGLGANQELQSQNGSYRAIMQNDGNFVIYTANNVPIWASNTYGRGSSPFNLLMQNDGNVVLYANFSQCAANVACVPTWASNTNGKGIAPYVLVMQNDGNLVAYDGTLVPIWATGTNR